ncbi:MAG TPA: DUF1385 domain-containing protein [Bryobacteraceae bacterium]|nr:DUF1385 domain-containing protein [Bryobacteraceae bacterium]
MPVLESGEETLVGGQAVVEGVMMRAPHSYCVAVRKPSGEIVTEELPLARMSEKYKIFRYPVFRGVGTLCQALQLGYRATRFSATMALDDPKLAAERAESKGQPAAKEIPAWAFAGPLVFSFAFFVFAYKYLPLFLVTRLEKIYPVLSGHVYETLVDGGIRLVILVGLLAALSRFKDIRRMFEYHGAEHKVVFNYESGQDVTVANAQRFSTFHPRCGTSFLFVVFVLAIPFYMLLPFTGFAAKLLARVVLIPLIAGVAYELIRFAARRRGSFLATLTAPGLWMQRITTKPPADEQTAIAIHALEGAMQLEAKQGGQLVIA